MAKTKFKYKKKIVHTSLPILLNSANGGISRPKSAHGCSKESNKSDTGLLDRPSSPAANCPRSWWIKLWFTTGFSLIESISSGWESDVRSGIFPDNIYDNANPLGPFPVVKIQINRLYFLGQG